MAISRIKLRRSTAAQWQAANPVLAEGEPGLESDTRQQKFGDGITAWNALPYALQGPKGDPGGPGIYADQTNPGLYFFAGSTITEDPDNAGLYTF